MKSKYICSYFLKEPLISLEFFLKCTLVSGPCLKVNVYQISYITLSYITFFTVFKQKWIFDILIHFALRNHSAGYIYKGKEKDQLNSRRRLRDCSKVIFKLAHVLLCHLYMICQNNYYIYITIIGSKFLREAAKKTSFLSGPATKAFTPPPSA